MIPIVKERNFLSQKKIGGTHPFFLIAGPCVIESFDLLDIVAARLKSISEKLGFLLIFKSSFDKANRSSIDSFRGPGIDEGLNILAKIKKKYGIPLLTDIHLPEEIEKVAEVVDILQIPAFLCRQTDLILEASKTGRWLNIKKGQFIAPQDALRIVEKVHASGSNKVLICERGYSFGYNNLVVDMRGIEFLRKNGVPVVIDATHSTQLPGGGKESGGEREMAYPLARAAVSVGVEGVFMETHPNPPKAKSDASNQLYLNSLEALLSHLIKLDALTKSRE